MSKKQEYLDENPDIIDLADVTSCELKISEQRNEQHRSTMGGKTESYNPRRFRIVYGFNMIIQVKHPYIDEMNFKIDESFVFEDFQQSLTERSSILSGIKLVSRSSHEPFLRYEKMGLEIKEAILNSKV